MYYVYLIKSEACSGQTYVGYTRNVEERLKKHNSSGCVYTIKYQPWKLHAYFAFDTRLHALNFEKYLKSHSGRAFAAKRLW